MKVWLHPNPKPLEEASSGIDIVVAYMHKMLPHYGINLVNDRKNADILAAHICPPSDIPVDVIHCHGLYPTGSREGMEPWTWELNKRVIEAIIPARVVTVPSNWVGEIINRDTGIVPTVVPHGVTLAEWPEREITKNRTVLWNKNRVMDVCSPQPMQELAKVATNFQFVSTFGTTQDNVTVTGTMPFPAMKSLIYQCGIYLATTKETFGVGIIEALAASLPVLGWGWGSLPDIIEHKVDGYIARPNDIADTHEGLKYIADNYDRMAKAARAKASKYDWSVAMALYAEAYAKALEHKQREEKGTVSIVIPCYNYQNFIADAIKSVQAQTEDNWECVLVDDGSTDKSVDVMKETVANDTRFRVISKKNGGVASARNLGAMLSTGHYITFLDADDIMNPTAIKDMRNTIAKDRRLGIVYGYLEAVDTKGNPIKEASGWPGPFNVDQQFNRKNQVPSCCMIRRDAFERTGGIRQHTAPCEDAEFWTRIMTVGFQASLISSKNPVYKYRVHTNSASSKYRDYSKPELDWLGWLPSANGGHIPFASIQKPANGLSHPVYDYDQPLVSFIIPCGPKHKALLSDALESVVGQLDPRWEILVVDDSPEGDLKEFGNYPYGLRYPFVRWLRNPKIGNVSAARNFGVANSKGKYLCFLDADDYLYRDFMTKTLLVILECDEDTAIVYSDWVSLPEGKKHTAENWNLQRLLDHALFAVTFLLPRTTYNTIGGFDESLDLWEDWDFTIKIALQGYKGIRVPHALFAYRYDTGERRERSLEEKERLLRVIKGRYSSAVAKPRRH